MVLILISRYNETTCVTSKSEEIVDWLINNFEKKINTWKKTNFLFCCVNIILQVEKFKN